jgi:small subunit ribosomal protein S3
VGQKVNPHGLRVGIIKDWSARWYAKDKDFANFLVEDYKIRTFIKKNQYTAGISHVEIERFSNRIRIHIHTAKPGMIIGKGGSGIEALKNQIVKMTGKNVFINIVEIKNIDMNAQLVAESIASQLERRVSFRRAMKQSIARTMRSGAHGIKTSIAGRVNGAEIARTEHYSEGNVPLQTLRADIDYGFAEANTTYGKIGVKVWINKGEVLPEKKENNKN